MLSSMAWKLTAPQYLFLPKKPVLVSLAVHFLLCFSFCWYCTCIFLEPIITTARFGELPVYERLSDSETETNVGVTEDGHYEFATSSQYNDYSLLNYESIRATPQSMSVTQNDDYDYIDSEQ